LLVLVGALLIAVVGLGSRAAADIPVGYVTDDKTLSQNMAVALTGEKSGDKLKVKAADDTLTTNVLGVAVSLDNSLIALSSVSPGVYVVSSGTAEVYVSDLNGAPKTGDLLAISPLKGILVKSVDQTKSSFGAALENFGSKPAQVVEIKDKSGKALATNVALMTINVAINPPLKSAAAAENDWLEASAASLTGRELSSVRIVAILIIFVTMMVVAGEIIFSVVSGSITAMGRNPLAKSAITRQSLKNALYVAAVLGIGTAFIVALVWV